MENSKIRPEDLKRIDAAFKQLSDMQGSPYERRTTQISLGSKDNLREIFAECFTRYDKSIPENRRFKWLPEYDKVLDWMVDNQGKGLFMFGDCGRGKSTIILGVLKPMFMALGKPFPGYHATLLSSKTADSEEWNYLKYRKWKIAFIDELGTERAVNDYGEKFEPFNEIMNMAEQNLDVLIISSNLTAAQFHERYGDRVMDRIKRLCLAVEFKGDSLRPL